MKTFCGSSAISIVGAGGRATAPKSAFTLIELLVVISILALLVALLVPSLRAAKDLAKLVQCLSQVRSLGLGVNFYAQEWDDCLPTDRWWGENPGGERFFKQLAPFVDEGVDDLRKSPVFECPMHMPYRFQPPPPGAGTSGCGVSYGYNAMLMAKWELPRKPENEPCRASKVTRPGTTITIGDHSDWDNTYMMTNPDPFSSWGMSDRHLDGSAMVFLDTHAEHHRPEEVGRPGSGDSWFHPMD